MVGCDSAFMTTIWYGCIYQNSLTILATIIWVIGQIQEFGRGNMKREVKFQNVKSLATAKKIIRSNYSNYTIEEVTSLKWSWLDKKVVFLHLKGEGDYYASAHAMYDPNDGTLIITRDNNNKVKRYNKLLSPIA